MSKDFRPAHRLINATRNPRELDEAITKQKYESGEGIRQFVKESRCNITPGTERDLPHTLPLEESFNEDGSIISERPKTKTVRRNN